MMQGMQVRQKKKDKKKKGKQVANAEDFPALPDQAAASWASASGNPRSAPQSASSASRASVTMPTFPGHAEPPQSSAAPHVPPPSNREELVRRNTQMVTSLKGLARTDKDFDQFKQSSKQFQTGQMNAKQFSVSYFKIFGQSTPAKEVFYELIALLPNEVKRQELLSCV
eukprot:TRINITY_DN60339_c0_g1_i1.p1 TRINITY_DN60339_c0_g1~~TRINITY_DN60339_c0_g1_i1.p1  ORF type:complete len:169 (+),score=23.50 TRINITY_DN60339_c0_g1_i1:174-680(+)